MTLIDLYGEDAFYTTIDGIKIQKFHEELPEGEIYLQDEKLLFIKDGNEKVLSSHVGLWKIINGTNIILSWGLFDKIDNNYMIIDLDGNRIQSGHISDEGNFIYQENDCIYSENLSGERKCIISNLNINSFFHCFFHDNTIHIVEYCDGTDFSCDTIYTTSGELLEKETRDFNLSWTLSDIILMLTDSHKRCDIRDKKAEQKYHELFSITKHSNKIGFEELDRVIETLKELDCLDEKSCKGYPLLKKILYPIFKNEDISKSIRIINFFSRSGEYGRANGKLITKSFSIKLSKLKKEMTEEDFAVCVNNVEILCEKLKSIII